MFELHDFYKIMQGVYNLENTWKSPGNLSSHLELFKDENHLENTWKNKYDSICDKIVDTCRSKNGKIKVILIGIFQITILYSNRFQIFFLHL